MTTVAEDEVVLQNPVYRTQDYDKFKMLEGNRHVDTAHVNELKRSIEDRGNLTQYFPVVVNDNLEVIDGQHRLAALKELDLPVYYEVKEGMIISDVIALNSGSKNWNWKDFMMSYADRNNANYINFKKLADEFGFGFSILLSYVKNERTGGRNIEFIQGDLQLDSEEYETVRARLGDLAALTIAANVSDHEFAMACLEMFKNPKYDQKIMEMKLPRYRKALLGIYYAKDYFHRLWDIYYRA